MPDEDRLIDVWIDLLPNQPNDADGRARIERLIAETFQAQVPAAIDRVFQLPPVVVHPPGEYTNLLAEARETYVHAHFYACVAMCGIVGERILKDVLRAALRIVVGAAVQVPSAAALDRLEYVEVSAIARFLSRVGLITDDGEKAAERLQQLRNAYAHARGKDPQGDALQAIKKLHELIEGSVSVFKTYDIRDGKLVPKAAP